jgi:glycosyltransferase involved in cell wall biosynthesis
MQPITPAVGGGRLRLLGLYHALGAEMPVTYVGTYDWPGESVRDQQLTPTLREITVPLSPEHFAAHERLRSQVGGKVVIDTTFHQLGRLSPAYVERAAAEVRQSDIVVFEHPWVYPLVEDALNPSRQLVVYDSQNVEGFLRMSMLDDGGTGSEIAREVIRVERALCKVAPLVLICSQEDRVLFHDLYGIPHAKTKLCPNGVFTRVLRPTDDAGRAQAKKELGISAAAALFIGSGYQFNTEAAWFIIEELAPRLPEVLFVVAGGVASSLPESCRTQPGSNVRITGQLSDEDKRVYLAACDLALNPMFGGSGTNIKMFDYLAAGLPVVTTSIGARGIADVGTPAFLIAPPEEFVRSIDLLLQNPQLRRQISSRGRRLVTELYSWERISPSLGILLERRHQLVRRPAPAFSVVLVTQNCQQNLPRALAALQAHSEDDCEIIVVDQSSHAWSGAAGDSRVLYMHTDLHGAAAAANLGSLVAQGEILAFLGDDFLPAANWLSSARKAFQRPQVAALSASGVDSDFVLREFVVRQESLSAAGGFLAGSGDHRMRVQGNWAPQAREDGRVLLLADNGGAISTGTANVAAWMPLPDSEFVRRAASSILGEASDPSLAGRLAERLEAGECSRTAVLEELVDRAELAGRRCEIAPLLPDIFYDEGIFLLSLDDLLRYDDAEFVTNLYRQALRRDPDTEGLESNLLGLRNGTVTREDVVRSVLGSEEAARVGVKAVGLDAVLPCNAPPGTLIYR